MGISKVFKIPFYMPGKNRTPNDNEQREKNQGKEESIYETIKKKQAWEKVNLLIYKGDSLFTEWW